MYLKQLELIGFKSFVDKTRLNFDPGIISIVGPNGCGKTNIVDGVRWVLGEQSAKSLRGKNMEDVIFHGTTDRKGTGMAEVSLTIDNTKKLLPIEYSEVTITRRVFRSGESQYFINKNLCRLKDIDNLFMGTGVGTRAYSVLEQGKMDLILSSKPEDRRFVFEEAAGITKYKEQKRETLRKIEVTENNLIRLNDIIKEVGRQIGSIERSAAKAKRYKKIQEELKQAEIKNLVFQLKNLQEEYSGYEREKQNIEKQSTEACSFLEEKEWKLKEMRSTLQRLNAESIVLHDEKLSIETKLVSGEHQLKYKSEKIEELKQRNKKIEGDSNELNSEIKNLHSILQEVTEQLELASEERKSRKEILEDKRKEVEIPEAEVQKLNKELEATREQLLAVTVRESQLKNELSHIEIEFKGLILKERKDTVEINRKKKELNNLASQLIKMEEVIKTQREALQNLHHAVKGREEKSILLKDEVSSIEASIQEKQQLMAERHSQYKIFTSQKKAHEGYVDGVKMVLENKQQLPGIIGIVSSIIRVPRKYRTAISAALGDMAQWIIADSIQNVYQVISNLKKNSISQTIFLAMNMLKKDMQEISESDLDSCPYIIRAIDAVEYEMQYTSLIRYVLGRVIIVKNIDSAKKLLLNIKLPVIVVTLDGIVLDSDGLAKTGTGGDYIELVSRDSAIEELKVQLQVTSEEILTSRQKQKVIEEKLRQEEGCLEGAKNNLYREEVNLCVLENDSIKQKTASKQIDEELQTLEVELEETCNEKEDFANKQKNKQLELDEYSKEIPVINTQLGGLTAEIDRLGKKRDNEERAYTELKITLIGAEERENHLTFKHQQLSTQLDTARNNIETISRERLENEEIIAQETKAVSELDFNVNDLSGQSLRIEEKLAENSNLCSDLEKKLSQDEDSIWGEKTQKDKLTQELNSKQLALAEIKLRIDNVIQKLQDQYRIARPNIQDISIENICLEELERQILVLRDKLEGMGEVSLVAISEYENLQERYDFLTSQRQDLVGAKESLLLAISKINSTTKKLFWETFEEIKKNFNEIFCRMFGGGKADLILIDESDMLESGIEIIARPPGKRLQNVSLLSGGEKALTAISLLFAIFKVKPSPFCLLDEIDAPLDDSNIDRFINLLKEFSKVSQFMIITHNKRTIGASQALYGVTMQEKGISKVVSVKFSEKVHST